MLWSCVSKNYGPSKERSFAFVPRMQSLGLRDRAEYFVRVFFFFWSLVPIKKPMTAHLQPPLNQGISTTTLNVEYARQHLQPSRVRLPSSNPTFSEHSANLPVGVLQTGFRSCVDGPWDWADGPDDWGLVMGLMEGE